jgi:DNA polymerase IV
LSWICKEDRVFLIGSDSRSFVSIRGGMQVAGCYNGRVFRVIGLIDMDAFYASVEQRDHPELRGQPVIVGSPPTQRGVVCAASYEARRYGVRSAMPSVTAGRLCPKGVFIPPHMDLYRQESRLVMSLVAEAGVLIEQVSVDEAFLDFSAFCQAESADASLRRALPVARALKKEILQKRQLTASIGIASNKLLAKLGSDHQKPDGLTLIEEANKIEFLRPLPVRVLHGVGEVTARQLQELGIVTVGDLQDFRGDLRPAMGSFAPTLKRYAFGEDDRPLDFSDVVKSISSENTFLRDTDHRPTLRATLWQQATEIATELQEKALAARTVDVRVRYSDFTTLNRQMTFEDPTADARAIYRFACHLLARHKLVHRPLRLIGLGVSHLVPPAQQLLLRLE